MTFAISHCTALTASPLSSFHPPISSEALKQEMPSFPALQSAGPQVGESRCHKQEADALAI
jgi:hypothetical protein